MDRNPRFVALGAALACALALAACRKDEPAIAAPPPEAAPDIVRSAPMAGVSTPTPEPSVSVTAVDLGNAVGDEQRVARPMTSFSPGDSIHASVSTRAADAGSARARLMARWTYQDGQVVDELGEEYDFSGEGRTVFRISNPGGWPTGTYKLEILLDGEVVQTRQFEVR
jgi:hypothetical protein